MADFLPEPLHEFFHLRYRGFPSAAFMRYFGFSPSAANRGAGIGFTPEGYYVLGAVRRESKFSP